jgi:hypothetical protein
MAILMSILRYSLSLIILFILLNSLRKGKPNNELTEEEKKQIEKNGGYRDIVKMKIAISIVLIGYIFISDTFKINDVKNTNKISEEIKIIKEDYGTIYLQYTFSKDNLFDKLESNFAINANICRAMKKIISRNNNTFKINIKGIFEEGRFITKDSYGNTTPVKEIVAFEATWWTSDIQKYNCDNYPDIWKHATIDNLWIEFRKIIRKDCEKESNYNKYLLCSKVM